MGTTWSARAIAPSDLDHAATDLDLRAELEAIIAEMSQWAPQSVLSRFNDLPKDACIEVSPRLDAVLRCALRIAAETDGTFDPSLGALVELWGFGARAPAADTPSAEDVAGALANAGWRKLVLDNASLRQPGGLRLDLAGIGKGYAVDALAAILIAGGCGSCLVEIGGEVRGVGVKPDGQPWWVDLEDPPLCHALPIRVALHDLAIATSGDYRRGDVVGERRISHTLDPKTGWPLTKPPASVSVLHASCMEADAYATALTVMGAELGAAFASRAGLAARFVDGDGVETLSPAFAAMLED
ncbi:MAG: FAD:protein FMN transferase [Hyphomonadaceae bacterium]